MKKRLIALVLFLVIVFVLVIIFLPSGGFAGDMESWLGWTKAIQYFGFGQIYTQNYINYFPIFLYILSFFGTLFSGVDNLNSNIYKIKALIISFNFFTTVLIAWFLKKRGLNIWLVLIILLNPAFFYLSLFWGQVEGIYIFFGVLAIIFALNKKPAFALAAFVFAFFTKLQAFVFLPSILLVILPKLIHDKKQILYSLAALVISTVIILFPVFPTLNLMFNHVLGSFDMYPVVSLNAYNLWYFIFDAASNNTSDKIQAGILTYKDLGLVLFIIFALIALFPIFIDIIRIIKKKTEWNNKFIGNLFFSTAMAAFSFFMLSTQMHERYLQPAIVLLGLAAIFKKSRAILIIYVVTSILYLLNLETVLYYFDTAKIIPQKISLHFISFAMIVTFLFGIFEIYRQRKFKL